MAQGYVETLGRGGGGSFPPWAYVLCLFVIRMPTMHTPGVKYHRDTRVGGGRNLSLSAYVFIFALGARINYAWPTYFVCRMVAFGVFFARRARLAPNFGGKQPVSRSRIVRAEQCILFVFG